MKIPLLLTVFALAMQIAHGATFSLPKAAPQFSIKMPDKWETNVQGDVITSRPSKESMVVVSVFPIATAKNLEDALAIVTRQVSENYSDFSVGEASQEKAAGMNFIGAEATAKKAGADMRFFLYAFSPDGQRYFAVTRALDRASGETYGNELDLIMDSIKSFKEEARQAKEKEDQAKSTVPFPKEQPVITLEVTNSFAMDATAERLILKTRKERKSFFYLAAIPAGDKVTNEASAKAWLPKKGASLVKAAGAKDATPFSPPEGFVQKIAGHEAFEIKYSGDGLEELRMWTFTPDGKRYYYAYFQRKDEDGGEVFEDNDAKVEAFWRENLMSSIKAAK